MVHKDHVSLIEKAIHTKGGVWADLGSGAGAFTLALRDIAGPSAEIYSIDINSARLEEQKRNFDEMFPDTNIQFLTQDFTQKMQLPKLDGILMANSLHYVKNKIPLLKSLRQFLKPSGKLLLVEYNVDDGNIWVPYPLSFQTLSTLANKAGYVKPTLSGTIPSSFLDEIYATYMTVQ